MTAPTEYSPNGASLNSEPTYSRRCGFWPIMVGGVFSALATINAFANLLTGVDQTRSFDGKIIYIPNPTLCWSLQLVASASFFVTALLLCRNKKLTTEPGHFWIVYGMFFVFYFAFGLSSIAMLAEIDLGKIISSALFGAIFALIPASINTMPEDYDGCCACLKCLKPWKVEQVLPAYTTFHSPQYPVQVAPAQEPQKL